MNRSQYFECLCLPLKKDTRCGAGLLTLIRSSDSGLTLRFRPQFDRSPRSLNGKRTNSARLMNMKWKMNGRLIHIEIRFKGRHRVCPNISGTSLRPVSTFQKPLKHISDFSTASQDDRNGQDLFWAASEKFAISHTDAERNALQIQRFSHNSFWRVPNFRNSEFRFVRRAPLLRY